VATARAISLRSRGRSMRRICSRWTGEAASRTTIWRSDSRPRHRTSHCQPCDGPCGICYTLYSLYTILTLHCTAPSPSGTCSCGPLSCSHRLPQSVVCSPLVRPPGSGWWGWRCSCCWGGASTTSTAVYTRSAIPMRCSSGIVYSLYTLFQCGVHQVWYCMVRYGTV
jgi:hypothetical protein